MRIISTFVSIDCSIKRVHELDDGLLVESVIIPHKTKINICISSQAGCRMGCAFCATGRQYFRNLTPQEILGQIDLPVDSVVFMGMGEPLDNSMIIEAIELIKSEKKIPSRKIVVSTCGLCDNMDSLLSTKVNIAISLNATRDESRSKLMPINQKFPLLILARKMKELDAALPKGRRLSIEYVLIKGLNDSAKEASSFSEIVPKRSLINLIPLNDTGLGFEPPSLDAICAFKAELRRQGYICFVREARGRDVKAACGMLAGTSKI